MRPGRPRPSSFWGKAAPAKSWLRGPFITEAVWLGPPVPVNCGAIPEKLLESELGMREGRLHRRERVLCGILSDGRRRDHSLLDEVNEMSPAMQVKLLRVLQDKQVCMVGARVSSQKIDVRITPGRRPRALVDKGAFREDLSPNVSLPSRRPPLGGRDRATLP